jgi:HK97 family phage prohead protease
MPWQIEGYAAIFSVPDQHGDIIDKDAFLDSLSEDNTSEIALMYNHRKIIGKVSASSNESGLYINGKIKYPPKSFGLSIGFVLHKAERDERYRRIIKAKACEVSLVESPANPYACIRHVLWLKEEN